MFSTEAKNKFSTNLCKLGSVESVYSPYGLIKETFRYYIDNRRDKLGGMIKTVSSAPVNMLLQKSFEVQFLTKSLKKKHSAIMSEGKILEGKMNSLNTFAHLTYSSLLVRFASCQIYPVNYSMSPSVKSRSLSKNQQNSPFFQVKLYYLLKMGVWHIQVLILVVVLGVDMIPNLIPFVIFDRDNNSKDAISTSSYPLTTPVLLESV